MPVHQLPAAVAPAPPSGYGFRRAKLGMDLAAWRTSAVQRASAPCVESRLNALVCRTPDQPLGGRYRIRDLTHTFLGGRLAKISFTTSIDGFAYVTAELKRDFGAPTSITRDRVKLANGFDFPHVLMTWSSGGSTILLSDPTERGGRLRVTISSGDAPSPA